MTRGHILNLRWNALLNDFRRSGLTQAEFCQRRGISIHSFRKRLYQVPTPQQPPANHISPTPPPPPQPPPPPPPSPSPRRPASPSSCSSTMDAGSPWHPASIPRPSAN